MQLGDFKSGKKIVTNDDGGEQYEYEYSNLNDHITLIVQFLKWRQTRDRGFQTKQSIRILTSAREEFQDTCERVIGPHHNLNFPKYWQMNKYEEDWEEVGDVQAMSSSSFEICHKRPKRGKQFTNHAADSHTAQLVLRTERSHTIDRLLAVNVPSSDCVPSATEDVAGDRQQDSSDEEDEEDDSGGVIQRAKRLRRPAFPKKGNTKFYYGPELVSSHRICALHPDLVASDGYPMFERELRLMLAGYPVFAGGNRDATMLYRLPHTEFHMVTRKPSVAIPQDLPRGRNPAVQLFAKHMGSGVPKFSNVIVQGQDNAGNNVDWFAQCRMFFQCNTPDNSNQIQGVFIKYYVDTKRRDATEMAKLKWEKTTIGGQLYDHYGCITVDKIKRAVYIVSDGSDGFYWNHFVRA